MPDYAGAVACSSLQGGNGETFSRIVRGESRVTETFAPGSFAGVMRRHWELINQIMCRMLQNTDGFCINRRLLAF